MDVSVTQAVLELGDYPSAAATNRTIRYHVEGKVYVSILQASTNPSQRIREEPVDDSPILMGDDGNVTGNHVTLQIRV